MDWGDEQIAEKDVAARMSTAASPPAAPPPDDDPTGRRVQIRGIREMPTGYDSEIGNIFCEMRRASQLTKEQLAERFATDLSTIDALETGALLALPDWAETSRVVEAYTEALGLDGRPILRRMALQLSPDATAQRSSAPPSPPPAPPTPPTPPVSIEAAEPAPRVRDDLDAYDNFDPLPPPPEIDEAMAIESTQAFEPPPAADHTPKRSIVGRMARWAMILMMIGASGAGLWFLSQRPGGIMSVVDNLPDPIPRYTRAAWELLGPLDETIPDPRSRKSDRLPVAGQTPANQ